MPEYRKDTKFNGNVQKCWEAANEIEAALTRQIALAKLDSEKRLLCAEMIIICQFYRDLVNPKGSSEPEYDGHF